MVTKRQIEKTTVHLLFSLFIQFSAIEIRRVFSHAKFMITWLQWLEKRWGARARWWPIAQYQGKSAILLPRPIFSRSRARLSSFLPLSFSFGRLPRRLPSFYVRVHEGVLNDATNYAQKGCAMKIWGITLIHVFNLKYVVWPNHRLLPV